MLHVDTTGVNHIAVPPQLFDILGLVINGLSLNISFSLKYSTKTSSQENQSILPLIIMPTNQNRLY